MGVNALNTRTKSDISTTSSSDPSLKCFFTVSGIHEPNVVLKDNDLKYKFKMHAATARDVALQLEADANFLLSIGVMDYSLLVGVHNNEFVIRADPDQPQSTSPLVQRKQGTDPVQISSYASTTGPPLTDMKSKSTDEEPELEGISAARRLEASRIVGADSYLFGIIDFQQKWTLQKKFERFLKIQFKGADPAGLSAIEPHAYKERFTHHMRDVLDVDDYFYES
jgi:1-phosphatidylinositol-4-phosphate 5-kinase